MRDLHRFKQVIRIVYEEGSAALLDEIGQLKHLPLHKRIAASRQGMPGPERARETLERLGTTYIKLGQLLSERPDIVPEEYAKEFKNLQDSAPEFDSDTARRIVDDDIGMHNFSYFSDDPMASASIAQVHAAELENGEQVIVKVRRPGIVEEVSEDLRILDFLAREAENHSAKAQKMRVHRLVEEFGRWTRNELDLTEEAQNAAEFKKNNAERENVYVPEVHQNLTSERVLTMERVNGSKITNQSALSNVDTGRRQLVKHAVEHMLRQYIVDGFFHADPHPSNIMVLEDGRIAYLDFGMMGREVRDRRNQMATMLVSMLNEDLDGYVSSLEEICYVDEGYDRQAIKRIARRNILEAEKSSFGDGGLLSIVMSLFSKTPEYGLHLPNTTALAAKSLAMTESLGMDVAPDLRVESDLKPVLEDCLRKNNDLETSAETFASDLIRNKELFEKAPTNLQNQFRKESRTNVSVDQTRRSNLLPAAALLTAGVLAYRFLPRDLALAASLVLGIGALTHIF